MQVELLDVASRTIEVCVWLEAIDTDRASDDAYAAARQHVEHCSGIGSSQYASASGGECQGARVDLPAPLAPSKAQTRPGSM